MKTPQKTPTSDQRLAAKYHCTERSIRRWRKDGAPFQKPKAMRTWLCSKRQLPRGTMEWLSSKRIAEVRQPAAAPEERLGIANALRRLESAEAQAYADLRLATATGDLLMIKVSREAWLRISESLRKHDLAVELNRREAGELVPRAQVDAALRKLAWLWRIAVGRADIAVTNKLLGLKDPNEVCRLLDALNTNHLITTIAMLNAKEGEAGHVPQWMCDALISDAEMGTAGKAGAAMRERIPVIERFFGLDAQQVLEACR